ncbi:hypothetical protein NL676_013599 [Syzygium grande]|nr:hypothetical protein NL676_013599 [Syzygium grande]
MKLSALQLQQSYLNRRNNSFRGPSAPSDSSPDGAMKSPAAMFWLLLHGLCCLISLVLGFRFSRLVFFLVFSTTSTAPAGTSPTGLLFTASPLRQAAEISGNLEIRSPPVAAAGGVPLVNKTVPRVVVGRHGIRIRPWPHPNPVEVMKAHEIIERVQREQRALFGVKSPRTVIAVTPTYVRTFQTLHMTGVMHSLMLVPYDLVWVVVEAGGASNETASILAKSGLRTIHVGFDQGMPTTWADRHKLEAKMRLHALRIVREEKLDGIVVFADDSNMHSMELFDEIQNVKWIGALSIGILAHSSTTTDESKSSTVQQVAEEENRLVPVQGPACNSSNKLVGWHTFNTLPYEGKAAIYIDDRATVLPRKLEWAGFVLNSRLIWKDAEDKPEWSPLSLVKDPSVVEPLGSCGRQVMLWWLRVEARSDSRFPPGWIIDPPLEITVPSKRTPWPDAPPELPSTEKAMNIQDNQVVKRPTKTRSSRSKRSTRSKRKHEARIAETEIRGKHTDQN